MPRSILPASSGEKRKSIPITRNLARQGNGQTDATGLAEDIIAQGSRSRPPAEAGAPAVLGERAAFGLHFSLNGAMMVVLTE